MRDPFFTGEQALRRGAAPLRILSAPLASPSSLCLTVPNVLKTQLLEINQQKSRINAELSAARDTIDTVTSDRDSYSTQVDSVKAALQAKDAELSASSAHCMKLQAAVDAAASVAACKPDRCISRGSKCSPRALVSRSHT